MRPTACDSNPAAACFNHLIRRIRPFRRICDAWATWDGCTLSSLRARPETDNCASALWLLSFAWALSLFPSRLLLFSTSCEKHPLGQMPEVQREQPDPAKVWSHGDNTGYERVVIFRNRFGISFGDSLGKGDHMAKHKYVTSPPNLTGMPPGVPYIIGNEAAERFSYYGMKSVLTVFMAHYHFEPVGCAGADAGERSVHVHALFRVRRLFPSNSRRDPGRRFSRQILDDSVAFDCLLPGQPHARVHGHVVGNRHRTTHNASDRIVPDLFGRRRH